MLGALLGKCLHHNKLGLAQTISAMLVKVDPDNSGGYVMFSDFLDVEHHWGDVSGGKWSMRENGVIKQPGSSWISINDWWMNFLLVQNHFLKGIAFVLSWMDWRKQ